MAGSLIIDNINGKVISSSPVATESQVIGVGQTWQDVTASRASRVTYTNTTGKTIALSIFAYNGNSVSVDGVGITTFNIGNAGATASHFAIVPNNSTYEFSAYSGIRGWYELR
jgi:hypothetical protein